MHVSSADAAFRLSALIPVSYLAFDALQADGVRLTALPYLERRKILTTIIPNGPRWLAPPNFPGPDLDAVRAASVANGLEGVVVKRLDSVYEPGARPGSWLKVKNQLRQEVVVAGWKPGQGNRDRPGRLAAGRVLHSPSRVAALRGACRDRVLRSGAADADQPAGGAAAAGLAVRRPGACPSMRGPQYG